MKPSVRRRDVEKKRLQVGPRALTECIVIGRYPKRTAADRTNGKETGSEFC